MNKQNQARKCIAAQRWQDAIPILVADISDNENDPWYLMYWGAASMNSVSMLKQ
ncbi:MAG: hypothetical protein ACI9R3_004522 [Verrucomicrobiales bacterium]|jgi:hypothetical protein